MKALIQKGGGSDQKQERKRWRRGKNHVILKEKLRFASVQEPEEIVPVKSPFSQV